MANLRALFCLSLCFTQPFSSLQITPFWPATNSLRLSIKYRDSRVTSQWFSISSPHQTTLRMAGGVSTSSLTSQLCHDVFFLTTYVCPNQGVKWKINHQTEPNIT